MNRDSTPVLVGVLAFATALTAVAGAGAVGASAIHDTPGNWTVVPGDRQPGASGVDYKQFAVGQAAWDGTHEGLGLRKVDYMVVTWEEGSFADCTLFNAEAFGFDRGNDQPGTDNEDFAGTYIENFAMEEDVMWMDFNDPDDAGPTTHFNRSDQFVAHQTGCYQNPDDRGWYRVFGWMNGTDYAGEHRRAELYSHYFYICECESRAEAREKLGPPPSEATPTPTETPAPAMTTTGGQTATATDGGGTAPPSPTADGDTATTTAATATATATATTASTDDDGGASPTPTDGDGPGFTAVAALVALVAAALLGRRRG